METERDALSDHTFCGQIKAVIAEGKVPPQLAASMTSSLGGGAEGVLRQDGPLQGEGQGGGGGGGVYKDEAKQAAYHVLQVLAQFTASKLRGSKGQPRLSFFK